MGLRINQNIAAQNAYRNLSVTDGQMSKSLEKLSSGFRINRAADDAAGLSISEGLRAQTGGLKVAVRNAQDAISVVQTAEGALNEVTSMLQRMRDLSVQASNASLDPDAKAAANKEFQQLNKEIDRIGTTTAFGKSKLLDGSFGNVSQLASTGTKVTDLSTALAAPLTFTIDKIDGKDVDSDSGTAGNQPISISVDLSATAATATAKDVTDALNAEITKQLKANGYEGNEFAIGADVAADGSGISFKAAGIKQFTLTDVVGLAALEITDGDSATGTGMSGQFQIGANAGETLTVGIKKISAANLGTDGLDLTTAATGGATPTKSGAELAITALDAAIKSVSDQRADLGAFQNRFEHTINNLNVTVENLSASESRIRDTDMAQEMVAFTRNQILTQAGTSMLSQANQASQGVLSLLR